MYELSPFSCKTLLNSKNKFLEKVYGYEMFIIENICNIENFLIFAWSGFYWFKSFFSLNGFFKIKVYIVIELDFAGFHTFSLHPFCFVDNHSTYHDLHNAMELDKGFCFISNAMFIFFFTKILNFFPLFPTQWQNFLHLILTSLID